ncbi:potassium-transporting ATPase subunit KdpB [Luteimicrobium subarcticum]|uniref:Potassium-transporting ATPase ATP-binding subunit n=1 Tax=Luteimicrobium subarcticum TaxID=620910 RepID=A0A2M8W6T9_9MICO|nr:potassium-transporting ATPase subunit KdpB [Luteimicrobium subarcticum]PJI86647.1 K+-transporting ATPase ATPase B chain [Luteimicrobium subarcticum]
MSASVVTPPSAGADLPPDAASGTPHAPVPTDRRPRALSAALLRSALPAAFRKLDPRDMWQTPVMFVVEVGAVLTTVLAVVHPGVFAGVVAVWLWVTVLFATLAEAVAESRGRAQASSLRATQQHTVAHRVLGTPDELRYGSRLADRPTADVPSSTLDVGDVVVVAAGEVVPGDGDVVEGVASVDESAITGESAPVIRESGGDRTAVTGGTTVLSDRIVVRITAPAGRTFVDRMIALVEGSQRQKTPNEVALNVLLASLTIVFLGAVATLQPLAIYSGSRQSLVVLVALLVCLIPTTIGALLSAIGIAGMDRLVQRNVLAMSGRAVEAAGDVDVLLLDKTGTITYGNRRASELIAAPGVPDAELADAARLASLADETPEGRSIVEFVERGADRSHAGQPAGVDDGDDPLLGATLVAFSASTRMSGVDLPLSDGGVRRLRKGAAAAVHAWVRSTGGELQPTSARGAAAAPTGAAAAVDAAVADVSERGGTPLVVAEQQVDATGYEQPARLLGVVHLKDVVKEGLVERFAELRAMGIRTVMVTGDNPVTARVIAAEAGVDDVLAEATPEDKLALIRREQAGGRLVAMCGDGTNDAPALAQADVGVAMASGTTAAKEAGNMVDLDSDPTKLIEIVAIGKQLLITRGALTTFSITNDVAKYFAILPAMFVAAFPQLGVLNVMHLHSSQSAIVSAVVFNALVIVALVPLALRGVRYRPSSAAALLRRNLWLYGLGGLVVPFLGIKAIDVIVSLVPGLR